MILFFDTRGERNRLALYRPTGKLVAERPLPHRGLSERLLETLDSLLAEARCGKDDLTGVAVMLGPGSYTGLRIGIAFANALALGLEIPMAGLSEGEGPASVAKDKKRFKRQWLRPVYGGEPKTTPRRPGIDFPAP